MSCGISGGRTNSKSLRGRLRGLHLEITGARATAARPTTKNKNMIGMSFRALAGALANSFQTNTPQIAETIVAPWPIAYEMAGPMICAWDATKFKTAPVHQMAPPRIPQKCQRPGLLA